VTFITDFPNITSIPPTHAVISCPCGFYCFAEVSDARATHHEHVKHCKDAYHEPPQEPRTAREVITMQTLHVIQVVAVVCAVGWIWLKYKGMI
jgi:hypothetical protein